MDGKLIGKKKGDPHKGADYDPFSGSDTTACSENNRQHK